MLQLQVKTTIGGIDLFGDRLRRLRERRQIYQKDLAKILGVSAGAIGMYETNKRTPDFEILNKIADYFDVTVDYLLGRTDDEEIKIYEKDQIPDKFKDLGLEYIEIAKELELSDISVEEMKKFIELMKIAKKKEQE
ncbi:MAG: helix-turn-helix domain-containing protein [Peptoclostridium sp.]|uniref:helix-turn-helix domain-containing protein n=1 Tax=Peptoclostridium sp. TaxID=1904860 RepID=UPI00139E56C6|nr:helix-turn-helix transcriptional regulator [Peptoclostridium sp.]MZQ75220.1 helix-turn-helix domain-containing protein [Peptoclostridium sp.]